MFKLTQQDEHFVFYLNEVTRFLVVFLDDVGAIYPKVTWIFLDLGVQVRIIYSEVLQ